MSIAEIESLYPEHFILIEEPQTDEAGQLVRGMVALAEKDKDVFYRRAAALKLERAAIRCTVPTRNLTRLPWSRVSTPEVTSLQLK